MRCFTSEQFDYNLLEPLQKLLRLSPVVAATLARPDMFSGLAHKLSHKKPDIRLNLLRLVKSICDPRQGHTDTIRRCGLLQMIQSLAENDPTVLVKNMASDFIKSCLETEEKETSGSRRRVSGYRRTSSYNLNSDQGLSSSPVTPTHKSRSSRPGTSFFDEPVTPQRTPITPIDATVDSRLSRQRSRETNFIPRGPSVDPEGFNMSRRPIERPTANATNILRRPSGDVAASPGKSRLPRTAALRSSRSSIAPFSSSSSREEANSSPARKGREPTTRVRGDTKSIDSGRPLLPPAAVSSRRRTKTQTNQDLRSS